MILKKWGRNDFDTQGGTAPNSGDLVGDLVGGGSLAVHGEGGGVGGEGGGRGQGGEGR